MLDELDKVVIPLGNSGQMFGTRYAYIEISQHRSIYDERMWCHEQTEEWTKAQGTMAGILEGKKRGDVKNRFVKLVLKGSVFSSYQGAFVAHLSQSSL
eukprot:6491595-Amphidinium_carterae.4